MLTVSRKDLLHRLEPAARVAPTRTPKEILRWVRLTHDGTGLTIVAWDGEVGIKLTMKCEGSPCDFLLPIGMVVPWLKMSTSMFREPDGTLSDKITIDPRDDGTHFSGTGEHRRFPVIPMTDWPVWEHSGESFVIPAGIGPAIQRVRCAVSEGDSRYALTGVYLNAKTGHIAATNSVLLCVESLPINGPDIDGVMPAKMADAAARSLAGDIKARMSKGALELNDGGTVVFGRLVQGMFPKYGPVMEKPCDATLEIGVGELLRVTRQAMLASDVERQAIAIDIADGTLRVSSGSEGRGDSCVEVPVASDVRVRVEVDGNFLASMLSGLDPLDNPTWHVSAEEFNRFTCRNWTGGIMPMAER